MPTFSFKKQLMRGVRPDHYLPKDSFLASSVNALQTSRGLVFSTRPLKAYYNEATALQCKLQPYSHAIYPSRGLPGNSSAYLFCPTTTSKYSVFYQFDGETSSPVTTYDFFNPAAAKNPALSGRWHITDFGETWALFNGSCVVIKCDAIASGKLLVQDTVTISTGCNLNGRFITGGFAEDDYWSADAGGLTWTDVFASYTETLGYSAGAPGPDFVAWSSVACGDFFDVLRPDSQADAETIRFKLKLLQSGLAPYGYSGAVLRVLPLGKVAIVYGTGGISCLIPANLDDGQGGVIPSFGVKKLGAIGAMAPYAVCEAEGRHVFLGQDSSLYMLGEDLKPTKLGYYEELSSLLPDNISIEYNRVDEVFYINGTETEV